MTKRREPITFHRALTIVAAHIGWDRCAAICGVTERAVRNWSDPDTDAEIRLIDARRLDQAYLEHGGAEPPFLQVYKLQLELAALSASERSKCLGLAASGAAKEGGEAAAALMRAASGFMSSTMPVIAAMPSISAEKASIAPSLSSCMSFW